MTKTIRTFTGRTVDPFDLRADEVDLRDIAHSLSNQCRYMGHCPRFYSVAEHSYIVSVMSGATIVALAGLLHDASEAYLHDIAAPLKHRPEFDFYREVEDRVQRTIFKAFDIPHLWPLPQNVSTADHELGAEERDVLWGKFSVLGPFGSSRRSMIVGFTPDAAYKLFLRRAEQLVSARVWPPAWAYA